MCVLGGPSSLLPLSLSSFLLSLAAALRGRGSRGSVGGRRLEVGFGSAPATVDSPYIKREECVLVQSDFFVDFDFGKEEEVCRRLPPRVLFERCRKNKLSCFMGFV